MTEPLIERIALNLATTLATVTTANGYHQDVADVIRPTRLADDGLVDRRVLLGQGEPSEAEDSSEAFKTWLQPFPAVLYVRPSEKDSTPVDTLVNRFRTDVEKAVMVDQTRGGLALDTLVRAYENVLSEDGALGGVVVHVEVLYRHRVEDPNDQN